MTRAIFLIALSALVTGCGGSNLISPADSNVRLYGTWAGTATITINGRIASWPIVLDIGNNSIAYYESGTQWPATLAAMDDPNIEFSATTQLSGEPIEFSGRRISNVICGSFCVSAGDDDYITGSWEVARKWMVRP